MAKERTIEKIKRAIKKDFAKLTKPISHSKKDLKRIVIDGRTYVRSFSENKFEVHIGATGPLGEYIYFFENGRLVGRQRKSWNGASEVYRVLL